MNKSVILTYLNEYKESLLVESGDIGGGRGLPLECRGVAQQLQYVAKAVNPRCDGYNIQ